MSIDPTRIDIKRDPLARRMRGVAVHGSTPFDVPYMSEIADNLWVGGCADGLTLPSSIRHVVSLYPWERYTVRHELDSFVTVRMFDSIEGVNRGIVDNLARWVNVSRHSGPVLVHCQAGLNRSGLVAGAALIRSGRTADEAIALLREGRSPACLCNATFVEFLHDYERSWWA